MVVGVFVGIGFCLAGPIPNDYLSAAIGCFVFGALVAVIAIAFPSSTESSDMVGFLVARC
jgi:hypothetical protein